MFDVGGQRSERKKWIHCFERWVSFLLVRGFFGKMGSIFCEFAWSVKRGGARRVYVRTWTAGRCGCLEHVDGMG
jgi:hypothetical protein